MKKRPDSIRFTNKLSVPRPIFDRVSGVRLGYGATAALSAVGIVIALFFLVGLLVRGWAEQNADLSAELVFRSIRAHVAYDVANRRPSEVSSLFERIAADESILALGYCGADGKLAYATKDMPKSFACSKAPLKAAETSTDLNDGPLRIHVSALPIRVDGELGHLLVLTDMSYIDERSRKLVIYVILAVIGVALGLGLLATSIFFELTSRWTQQVRGALEEARRGLTSSARLTEAIPVNREIRALLTEVRSERRFANGVHVEWSPETLQQLLAEELPGSEVLIVSNREPYIHNRAGGGVRLQIPASGLVAALEPVMRACGGAWIAHGSGSADVETADAAGRLRVPPFDPSYTLRRVWISEAEQEGYYYGFSNEGLWPLCHMAFVRPMFREADWVQYRNVNARFADAVVEEAKQEDPIILIQDYHFALLPRMLRERLPKATLVTFWHIPWPNAETFSICPWRQELLDGLLGSSIIGFHTQLHCNNFFEAADRFLESRLNRDNSSITFGGHETLIRPYPISIAWPEKAKGSSSPREAVISRYSLPPDVRIAVGVERFDYTKGILDRIRAVDDFLERHVEWRGRFVLLQVAAPTRSKLEAYASLQGEAIRLAEEVNAKHAVAGIDPVRLIVRHHEPEEVSELFRAADICIVSSLHDGMNLVAKEFVAARDDEAGVLLLSSFAGASFELSEAILVNPYDTRGMAEGIATALLMPRHEQAERMKLMRDLIRQRNVYHWAAQMLIDSAWLRRRIRVTSQTV